MTTSVGTTEINKTIGKSQIAESHPRRAVGVDAIAACGSRRKKLKCDERETMRTRIGEIQMRGV